jgi:hypothetical protein
MFLIDDILLAPARGLFMVFREVREAAEQELAGEADDIRNRLSELYVLLERGELSEQDFDEREGALLDRLDQLEAFGQAEGEGDEEDGDEDEDEDEGADELAGGDEADGSTEGDGGGVETASPLQG